MSRKSRTTLSVVEKLIEQRRLFQDWLTKLDGEVDGMPDHVVARVKNDYRARFDGVMAELGEHADALREALDEAQLRHDGLDSQQQAKKDELAELKLRRHVGEMDEARYKDQSGVMKSALDGIQKELAAAAKDIERFEEILSVIASDEKPVEPEPEPEPVAPPVAVEEDEDDEAEAEEPEDEVVVRRAAASQPRREEPKSAPRREAAPAREERRSMPEMPKPKTGVDELAFLRSVTSRPIETGKAPRQEAAPARKAEPAPVEEFNAAPNLLHMPPSEHDEPEPTAAVAAAPAAKDKNAALVCGECGATNRPTEWYCEKCGAELAAF